MKTKTIADTKISNTQLLSLICICFTGIILRIWNIDVGLPDLYHTDEVTIVSRSLQTAKNNLDPGWIGYPTLWFYVLDLFYGIYFLVGKLIGSFNSTEAFAIQYVIDPTIFYLIPRLLNVILGTLITITTFVIGYKFFHPKIGLLAAAFVTFDAGMIEHSRYATLDIPATLWVVLATYTTLLSYTRPSSRNYIISGLIIGLGMSTKYFPVISSGSFFIAHIFLLTEGRVRWYKIYYAVLFVIIGFLAGTPFFFKNISSLFSYVEGQQLQATFTGMLAHNYNVLKSSLGLWIITGFTISILPAIVSWKRPATILLSTVLLYFFSYALFSKSYYERWHITYFPALYLILSIGIYKFFTFISSKNKLLAPFIITIFIAILVFHPLERNRRFLHNATLMDTRLIAKAWIEDQIPDGEGIFIDSGRYLSNFSVPLKGYNAIAENSILLQSAKMDGMLSNVRKQETRDYYEYLTRKSEYKPLYRLVRSRLAMPLILENKMDAYWLNSQNITYAVLSDYYSGRYLNHNMKTFSTNSKRSKMKHFYENLVQSGEIIAKFKPGKDKTGPSITIIKINSHTFK